MNIDAITPQAITWAAEIDDLDDAVCALQLLGDITDGGVAGVCFSDVTFDWGKASREERENALRNWLETERAYQ